MNEEGMGWKSNKPAMVIGGLMMILGIVWVVLSSASDEMFRGTFEGHFGLITLFGSISVAWGFHILAVNWLKAGQTASTTPSL